MYKLSDYYYDLPKERIAQTPAKNRLKSKLLHINRGTGHISHLCFDEISGCLNPGDVLVVNNTKVVPARLWGQKKTGGRVEVLILDYAAGMRNLERTGFFECDCLMKASKNPKKNTIICFKDGVQGEVVNRDGYVSRIRFLNGPEIVDYIQKHGQMPLPPYIQRETGGKDADREDYQTVYAKHKGAVAAPTAGLHFTDELLESLLTKGVIIVPITLHVGYGTFVPVRVDDIRDHQIHSEWFTVSDESAAQINSAKKENRRVIAVGTTSVRTLEYLADEKGNIKAGSGRCDLFIYPGYRFKCIDAMITNFHLPESTLLMLVSAFYSRDKIIDAYQQAIEKEYRFFSYGDAMLIE